MVWVSGLFGFHEKVLLALPSGPFGGSEQGRSRGGGREVTFMEHALCAQNPPSSHAADFGFICTRKLRLREVKPCPGTTKRR